MHVQNRADTLEYFFKLILVLHLDSVCLLFSHVSRFVRLLVETKIILQNLWFWNVGRLFPICLFFCIRGPFIFPFLPCLLSLLLASFPSVFVVVPSSLVLSAPSLLSPLPKHWDHCSSFPNITRLILTLLIGAFLLCSHASGRAGRKVWGDQTVQRQQTRDVRAASWDVVRKMA